MPKRILTTVAYFCLLFLPSVSLSIWAYTVFHQVILLASVLLLGSVAYYLSKLKIDRDRLGREVFLQAYELKKSKEALQSCLAIDTQTHVYNARLLDARLTEECDRARRYQRPLAFLFVHVDAIAQLSKTHGGGAPEIIVHEVAQFLKEMTRSVDIVVRNGEDRFVIILPETQLNQARMVAERIRYGIEKNTFRLEGQIAKITVSVGFINFDVSIHRNKEDVMEALERAMAYAKKGGANQIATLTK